LITIEKITDTMATPSEYFTWLRYSSATRTEASEWKCAMSCGEALTTALTDECEALQEPDLRFLNMYGPSEITMCSDAAEIAYQAGGPVTVGKLVPNYQTYIVDRNMDLVAVGVSGEIVIGGAGVSKGYLNNDELTKSQFIPDVYASEHFSKEWPMAYRTGDLAHQLNDGTLVYEGRIAGDTQIKLRGIRIELKDIESTIITAAGGAIFKAVVSLRGDSGFLVAHVEFDSEHQIGDKEGYLKALLAGLALPKYMCPSLISPLESIPLNSHSKVDRRAVAAISLPVSQRDDNESDEVLNQTELAFEQSLTPSHFKGRCRRDFNPPQHRLLQRWWKLSATCQASSDHS
jgi:hybrid polyketide synthase/nonribosomal peptide synthetase ACE1